MGLLVGDGSLLLSLRCNARGSRLNPEGLKRGGFELSDDDAESSVLAAFQLIQSGWGQLGLPGWGSVVDNTVMKSPIDLEELIFLQPHLFEVSEASSRHRLEALETNAATCGPKERALSMVTPRNFGREVVLRVVPSSCNDGC